VEQFALHPSGNNLIEHISCRLLSFQNFDHNYVSCVKYEIGMLMFLYEYMHEKLCVAFPIETESGDSAQKIQEKHNTTVDNLLKIWKPESMNFRGLRTFMKVLPIKVWN